MSRIQTIIAGAFAMCLSATIHGQGTLEEWTEGPGILGLGYPVPIPVDTPLPFDGFRTYNGLHTRYQDLANMHDFITAVEIGTTLDGRIIWAYQLGDSDALTHDLLPEPATLTNGGVHAREWQSPETITGIIELFADQAGDRHFYDYLLENVNMIVIPVLNIDGFLQSQRYPSLSYMGTDPGDIPPRPGVQLSPRDGRMRRKSMFSADEIMVTRADHLYGVDLNRNNPPFWATNPGRSSPFLNSIVHHGPAPHSEPETMALRSAPLLGPENQLRLYTDIHSFGQVHFWHRTNNLRLSHIQAGVLNTFTNHHLSLPGNVFYAFNASTTPTGGGIGTTDEYFSETYQIPSWTLEIEPTQGQSFFPNNPPGCGADYGGLASNCHDGFILPEAEIRRVREQLAQSFAAVYYQQAGPPALTSARVVDTTTQAVVYEFEWDPVDVHSRVKYVNQIQPIQLGRDYQFWLAFDRPMRWRTNGEISVFPGQPSSTLNITASPRIEGLQLNNTAANVHWNNQDWEAPNGYYMYQDDAVSMDFNFPRSSTNMSLLNSSTEMVFTLGTSNMTGQQLDTDPSTPVGWANGGWSDYEDSNGFAGDSGGIDTNFRLAMTNSVLPDPFTVEPGSSAAWFDSAHTGEGFVIEILANNRAVMYWFTYDENGEQAWYIAVGEVRGNRLLFPEIIQTSGGVFGPDFDPDTVVRTVVGSASFLYESCDTGTMVYHLPNRKGRFNLVRLSRVMGANCGRFLGPPIREEAIESGSWYNLDQSGHGFTIEVLADGRVLVYWFSYDFAGNQAWFFGTGTIEAGELVITETFQTAGPTFGPDFNPGDLVLIPWGELRFDLSCSSGSVTYNGTAAGYGMATLGLNRLTFLEGLGCQ